MITELAALVLSGSEAEWIGALPGYQANVIGPMVTEMGLSGAADRWLSTSGPKDTAGFGAIRSGGNVFFGKLLVQIRALLCDADSFPYERAELVKQAGVGRSALVTGVASVIGHQLGVSPVVLAPAIALLLAVLSKAGVETACEVLSELIAAQGVENLTVDTET